MPTDSEVAVLALTTETDPRQIPAPRPGMMPQITCHIIMTEETSVHIGAPSPEFKSLIIDPSNHPLNPFLFVCKMAMFKHTPLMTMIPNLTIMIVPL
jgi:hypothetical protein